MIIGFLALENVLLYKGFLFYFGLAADLGRCSRSSIVRRFAGYSDGETANWSGVATTVMGFVLSHFVLNEIVPIEFTGLSAMQSARCNRGKR